MRDDENKDTHPEENFVDGTYEEVYEENLFEGLSDDPEEKVAGYYVLDTGERVPLSEMEKAMVDDIYKNGNGTDQDKATVCNNLLKSRESDEEKKAMYSAIQKARANGCETHDLRKFANDYAQINESIQDVKLSHKCRMDIINAIENANKEAEKVARNAGGLENADQGQIKSIYNKALVESQKAFKANLRDNIKQGKDERQALKKVMTPTDKTAIIRGVGGIGNSFAEAMDDPFKAMISFTTSSVQLAFNIAAFHKQRAANKEAALNSYISKTGTYHEVAFRPDVEKATNIDSDLRSSLSDLEVKLKNSCQSKEAFDEFLKTTENSPVEGAQPNATYTAGKLESVEYKLDSKAFGNVSVEYNVQTDKFTYKMDGASQDMHSSDELISEMKTQSFRQSLDEMVDGAKSSGQDITLKLGKEDGFTQDFTITAKKDGDGLLTIKHGSGMENRVSPKRASELLQADAKKAVGKTRNATAKVAKIMQNSALKTAKNTAKTVGKAVQAAKTAALSSNPYTAAAKAIMDTAKKLIAGQVQKTKSRQASAIAAGDER